MKKLITRFWAVSIALMFVAGCTSQQNNPSTKTFVLVHGAWQAPFVWNAVKTQLENKKQQVIVVELPAHGDDTTLPVNVSMDAYRNKVIDAVKAVPGKVILVGHSMGGVVVTAVAEKVPEKIDKIIYVGAFIPSNGQSLADLAFSDSQSQLGPALLPSKDQLTLDVKRESIVSIFCQDAPAETQKLVLDKFRVEPAIPFSNKITLTANYASADKYYIHTSMDHAIGMDLQKKMVEGAHISKVYSINTGHSPFLSKPEALTEILLSIAR